MEIKAVTNINFPLIHRELAKGQQVKVEVLNRENDGKAQIRLNGQEVAALLDFPEATDEFTATVLNIEDRKIVLQKLEPQDAPPLVVQAQQKVLDGKNISLTQLLSEALGRLGQSALDEPQTQKLNSIVALLAEAVPEWAQLATEGKKEALAGLVKRLGFDYEHRLQQLLSLPSGLMEQEIPDLIRTLKGNLLALLTQATSNGDTETKNLLAALADNFTEQQLQLHGAHKENPFFSFDIPLRHEGEIYNQRIAIKAARKGLRLDSEHCRLAIQASTPCLGELGIEGWLYEGQLTIKVLAEDPIALAELIEENKTQLREQLNLLGISLQSIGVVPISEAADFQRFLRGEFREGVDLRI